MFVSCVHAVAVLNAAFCMTSSSSSVYSPFSDRVGLPPHNIPFQGVLMKSIGAVFLTTVCHSRRKPHAWNAISNSSKYNIHAGISTNLCV